MSDLQRFDKALKYIKLEFNLKNQAEIAEKLGYNKSYLSEIRNGKYPISEKTSYKIEEIFGISANWLLTGNGEMLRKADNKSVNQSIVGNNNNSIISSNVKGSVNAVQHSISPETTTENSKYYLEIIKKQQEQIDKLIEVVNKLSDK